MSESKRPRIVTSYLAHPLWREKRDGILRVPVCRQLRFFADRKDANWSNLVPSADAVTLGKQGEFGLYRLELSRADLLYAHVLLGGPWDQDEPPYFLVVLLCWEGDPMMCHRRLTFEALKGRLWTPEDEALSPYGGLAEVGE